MKNKSKKSEWFIWSIFITLITFAPIGMISTVYYLIVPSGEEIIEQAEELGLTTSPVRALEIKTEIMEKQILLQERRLDGLDGGEEKQWLCERWFYMQCPGGWCKIASEENSFVEKFIAKTIGAEKPQRQNCKQI